MDDPDRHIKGRTSHSIAWYVDNANSLQELEQNITFRQPGHGNGAKVLQ